MAGDGQSNDDGQLHGTSSMGLSITELGKPIQKIAFIKPATVRAMPRNFLFPLYRYPKPKKKKFRIAAIDGIFFDFPIYRYRLA